MLIVHVHIQVRPDQVEAFRAACVENSRNSLQEPGIARFDVLQQQDDPTRWLLYEVYDKEQAWVDHRKAAHFVAFMEVGNRAILTREAAKLTGVNVKS